MIVSNHTRGNNTLSSVFLGFQACTRSHKSGPHPGRSRAFRKSSGHAGPPSRFGCLEQANGRTVAGKTGRSVFGEELTVKPCWMCFVVFCWILLVFWFCLFLFRVSVCLLFLVGSLPFCKVRMLHGGLSSTSTTATASQTPVDSNLHSFSSLCFACFACFAQARGQVGGARDDFTRLGTEAEVQSAHLAIRREQVWHRLGERKTWDFWKGLAPFFPNLMVVTSVMIHLVFWNLNLEYWEFCIFLFEGMQIQANGSWGGYWHSLVGTALRQGVKKRWESGSTTLLGKASQLLPLNKFSTRIP